MQSIADGANGERRARAQERIDRQNRRQRWSRWADREMPLAEYYRCHRGGFYCRVVEGWRVA